MDRVFENISFIVKSCQIGLEVPSDLEKVIGDVVGEHKIDVAYSCTYESWYMPGTNCIGAGGGEVITIGVEAVNAYATVISKLELTQDDCSLKCIIDVCD